MGHIDPVQAATGELLMDLYDAAGVEISAEAALCLYIAQITDTGGYRYSNTTATSHEKAARLVRTGIDVASVSSEVFYALPRAKFELMRSLMAQATFHVNGVLAVSWLSAENFRDAQATREDTEGLVNVLKHVNGVRVAALFTSYEAGTCKVSLRSEGDFDCAAFLRPFGGGGHVPAAGATFDLPLEVARQTVLAALEQQLSVSSAGNDSGVSS
jgi:phosphoesterase RecJ-like protein